MTSSSSAQINNVSSLSFLQDQQTEDQINRISAVQGDSGYFNGSVQDLKTKYPEIYEQLIKFVSQGIFSQLNKAQQRLMEEMKKLRNE